VLNSYQLGIGGLNRNGPIKNTLGIQCVIGVLPFSGQKLRILPNFNYP